MALEQHGSRTGIARFKWPGALSVAAALTFVLAQQLTRHAGDTQAKSVRDRRVNQRQGPDGHTSRGQPQKRRATRPDFARIKRVLAEARTEGAGDSLHTETPDERSQRHAQTLARLPNDLGLTATQTTEYLFLADVSNEVEQGLQRAYLAGDVDHKEYMTQTWELTRAMYKELASLLSEDQFRRLTGLEPWADPVEYMKTGEGEAIVGGHSLAKGE